MEKRWWELDPVFGVASLKENIEMQSFEKYIARSYQLSYILSQIDLTNLIQKNYLLKQDELEVICSRQQSVIVEICQRYRPAKQAMHRS